MFTALGFITLGGIAAFAVYQWHGWYAEYELAEQHVTENAMLHGMLQYAVYELATSELDLAALDEDLGTEYSDGYATAYRNVQDELKTLLAEDGKRIARQLGLEVRNVD